MKYEQKAGAVSLNIWDDGWPLAGDLVFNDRLNEPVRVGIDDLHDLRYCIDRVLAKLPAKHRRAT